MPVYNRGETVWYERLNAKGRVIAIINEHDPMDRKAQGYRYTIKIGKDLWSVPESSLRGPNYEERFKLKQKAALAVRGERLEACTPSWVDEEELKSIYKACPDGLTVDHIVPICNAAVCGLHVPCNLQYLTRSENSAKSNTFTDKGQTFRKRGKAA